MIKPLMLKPIRISASLFIVALIVLGSCQSGYAADDEISAMLMLPFRIVLAAAIGSTGYSWSAQLDKASLKLKKPWHEKPKLRLLGAPGRQISMFVH
ncbi:MAG: hypothetical protein ACYDHG_18350 [Desulfomonilaceae bacterium]